MSHTVSVEEAALPGFDLCRKYTLYFYRYVYFDAVLFYADSGAAIATLRPAGQAAEQARGAVAIARAFADARV